MSSHKFSTLTKNLFLMHFVVIIFGFTGILGKLITLNAIPLVFWRTLIGGVAIYIWLKLRGKVSKKSFKELAQISFVGLLVAIHWSTFFASIKASNVSVALTMLALSPMFVGFLEPLIFRRKLDWRELLVAFIVLLGVATIFSFDTTYHEGIILGIISAFFASLFATLNGVLIKSHDASNISLVELISAATVIFIFLLFRGDITSSFFVISSQDWLLIAILAIIATSFAFIAFTSVMKVLTPFTTSVAVNLEPIYAIILAVLIFGEEEVMSTRFYLGAFLILGSVILNTFLKKRES
ncbi:MAG TPA: DMT family transporter [Flavobacteriales bacterium]|nr:DMT family transporter [Flavobacteriales bacterium]HIN41640.1 DMT family transporter [Flavobacteriales bacterium]HIO16546.1 DMT family transporter [Flavobacteriales bacterium]HIO60064.1 DMT family transporter [Flavobacteriales bacterium]